MTQVSAKNPFDLFVEHSVAPSEQAQFVEQSAVVCDASNGNRVLYVSSAFESHTGYRPDEAIGRNLSFLQGPETEPDAIALFRHLLKTGAPGKVRITNYRKDNTCFLHECDLRPVRAPSGEITHYIAIQRPV
ncbi:MAG: PAS domain-containing protein [Pseudomonadota bacterium]